MTSEREERPGRQFAGEPQAKRARGESLEARESNQAQRAPGRRTLAESLDPAPIDVARVFDAQLAIASRQLVALEAANHAGNHHASCMAAAGIGTTLRIAETLVARARMESGHRAGALQRRLAGAREAARSALEQAFTPSAAAKREAVDGVGRSQWHREVAVWRAARGLTDLEAVSTATAPEARAAAGSMDPANPQHATAAEGIAGAGAQLPHLDEIQRSFGRHDLTGVRTPVGGTAAQAARALGAAAYTTGSSIAFAAPPDLHTAAHEAAHIVQQRAGVVLDGGFGTAGDRYERHADAVADRVVAGRSAELLLDAMIGSRAGASPSRFAIQRKDDPTAKSSGAAPAEPWQHLFGAESTPVNKLGRVQAPRGRTLLQKPSPGSPPSMPAPLPFDASVMIVRRTVQSTAAERWCYVTAPEHGAAGFCEERYLAMDPPEPRARLHRVEGGETLGKIARAAYGQHITAANDERLYVQGLYEANKDRAGVKLTPVQLSTSETWHRREAEERTLEVYRGVQVLEGMSLWIPSNEFMQRLKASGAITSGSSELSKAWRAAAEFVDDAIEAVKYAAGFIVGLLEGAWSAIVDLFKGALEMIETIATVLYHLVTMNPWRIKDMLMKWVDKMKSAWEHRGQIADEFMKKWNAPSGWDRGRFQGEVLGWVVMTVLIIIATAGSGAAANAGSLAARFPQVVKLLKTVDAVGDVTTYLGGAVKGIKAAGKLPEAAADVVKGKLGKASRGVDTTGDAARDSGSRARAIDGTSTTETPDLPDKGVSDRKKGKNKPQMESTATPLDGGPSFKVDFLRDLSPKARGLVRKLEKQGFVRVSEIAAEDLVQISKWFGKEIAVVQSPFGRLRIIIGNDDGILSKMLKPGEVFVVHTHPVMRSVPGHFTLDLAKAGKHVEAVIDWNGLIIYYSKTGIRNPREAGGRLERLQGYQAAFMDQNNNIIGFARIDVLEGPTGTRIKVKE